MRLLKNQSGVSIIAALFIIVILAFMGMVFLTLFTTTSSTSINELQSTRALYVAEGGLERAVYQYKNDGTACASLINTNIPLGTGNFTTSGTLYNPSPATTLSSAIGAADTIIPVVSTAGYAPNGRIRIDSEEINYSSIAGNSFTGAQRGAAGSTAAAHALGALVLQNQCTINSTGVVGNAQRVEEKVMQQNSDAMMVYAKLNGDGTPYFRRWNGTSWGAEQTATAVPADIHFFVLKFARTRNEAILGTISSDGSIRVQIWNGNTQTWSATTLLANVGGGDSVYRGFDIEYETIGDRAIVVYNDNSADPNYRIWDGAAWSGATNINLPTTGEARWIELSPNPLSDEIVMITLDANADVYGMRWPGGGAPGVPWSNMGAAAVWDASAANGGNSKAIDVTYEQQSGRALFMWGDANSGDQYYRIWNGTILSANTLLSIGTMGGTGNRIRLAPDTFSNQIMYAVQDSGRDLFTAIWSGLAWTAHPRHDNNTEDANDRNFDIVFETHPLNSGVAWLVWGSRFSTDFTARRRFAAGAWGATAYYGDDAAFVQMLALPRSGEVFAVVYQDSGSASDDITEAHLTGGGGVWSAEAIIWNGGAVANPVYNRVFLAAERYNPTVGWREVFQ